MIISRCRAALAEIELGRIDRALGRLDEALARATEAGMREATFYALTGIGRAWAAAGNDEDAALLLSFTVSNPNPYQQFATPALEAVADRVAENELKAIGRRAAELDLDAAVELAASITHSAQ